MRKQIIKTLSETMDRDSKLVVLLGDIGVYGLRDVFIKYPDRIYNLGILEQASIGFMAGLAAIGFIPVFHTIAPFMVERALEQIKLDFMYQGLIGQFISVGGSYDYPALGLSHQAPGDIQALLSIPNLRIVIPGSASEFDIDFRAHYNQNTTYYRLSERGHGFNIPNGNRPRPANPGHNNVILAFGPILDNVMEAISDLSCIDVIYYNTIQPFIPGSLRNSFYETIIIVSPFYRGTLAGIIADTLSMESFGRYMIHDLSIPKPQGIYQEHYGTVEEHDKYYGLDPRSLRERIQMLI